MHKYDKTQVTTWLRGDDIPQTVHRTLRVNYELTLQNVSKKGHWKEGGFASSTETGPNRIGEGRGYSSIARH